jgi:hypothetical protein
MRLPTSTRATFRGTRVWRRPSVTSGSALVRPGVWRPPRWFWLLPALLAAVGLVVLLQAHRQAPSAPTVSAPAGPRLPALSIGSPSFNSPHLPVVHAPHVGTPDVSAPHVGTPHIGSPNISAPSIHSPDVNVETPSVDAPETSAPSFHISFNWLFDFFSFCWQVIWFIILIPSWVILLAVLVGRWLWLAWARRKREREEEERDRPPMTTEA